MRNSILEKIRKFSWRESIFGEAPGQQYKSLSKQDHHEYCPGSLMKLSNNIIFLKIITGWVCLKEIFFENLNGLVSGFEN